MGAAAVRALRQAVLRPSESLDDLAWPGDDDPRAGHFAILDGGHAVAVATIVPEPHPEAAGPGDWRLRGMATDPAHRGQGLGARLVEAAVAHATAEGASRVWCHARPAAIGLYERAGFTVESDEFEVPGAGPHRRMSLLVG